MMRPQGQNHATSRLKRSTHRTPEADIIMAVSHVGRVSFQIPQETAIPMTAAGIARTVAVRTTASDDVTFRYRLNWEPTSVVGMPGWNGPIGVPFCETSGPAMVVPQRGRPLGLV